MAQLEEWSSAPCQIQVRSKATNPDNRPVAWTARCGGRVAGSSEERRHEDVEVLLSEATVCRGPLDRLLLTSVVLLALRWLSGERLGGAGDVAL